MAGSEQPLLVTFRVPDRAALHRLLDHQASATVEAETTTIVDPAGDETEPLSIEVGHLTEKQWEALAVAHDLGHYEAQRGGNLEAIAETLDVSKSAASQRLRSAEAKIVSALLGTRQSRREETQ